MKFSEAKPYHDAKVDHPNKVDIWGAFELPELLHGYKWVNYQGDPAVVLESTNKVAGWVDIDRNITPKGALFNKYSYTFYTNDKRSDEIYIPTKSAQEAVYALAAILNINAYNTLGSLE